MSQGGTIKNRLEAVNADIQKELQEWADTGLPEPSECMHTATLQLAVKIDSLVQLLLDKKLITEDELNLTASTRMLAELQGARPNVVAFVKEQRRASLQRLIKP